MKHLLINIRCLKSKTVQIWLLFAISLLPGFLCAAESLMIKVSDQMNQLLENTVVSAYPQDQPPPSIISESQSIIIDQIDKEFINHVTAIQIGTRIEFPNHDQIHHHVYSFSSAKSFEIPLYQGSPKKPVLFDKTGMVSLGCNIHDWMSAYIYVLNTPYFATTNKQGIAILELPDGDYEVQYWHPDIDKNSNAMTTFIKIPQGSNQTSSIQLTLKKVWSFRRGPLSSSNQGNYR